MIPTTISTTIIAETRIVPIRFCHWPLIPAPLQTRTSIDPRIDSMSSGWWGIWSHRTGEAQLALHPSYISRERDHPV
jgi:hypothetical protein